MAGVTFHRIPATVLASLALVGAWLAASAWGQNPDLGEPTGPAPGTEQVVEVRIVGNRSVSTNKIFQQIQTRAGRPFRQDVVERDVRQLATKGWFIDVRPFYQQTPQGKIVVFQVAERPTLRYVQYLGNVGVRDKTLNKETGLKVGDAVDPYAIEEGRRKILQFYQERGYNKVQVEILEGTSPKDSGAVYVINEGPKQRVLNVSFVGNTIASDARLKTQIESKPGIFWYIKGYVDRKKIDEDIDKLTAYYRSLGFFRARVGRELEYNEEGNWLTLTFVIDEGPRYKVRNVSFLGNKVFETKTLNEDLKLTAGEYFNQDEMNADVNSLRDIYGGQGFVFADIKASPRTLEGEPEIDLVYEVEEGSRYRVGRINVHVQGENPHTREKTVLNRLSLQPGQIVDVRELRKSERRLRASSIFENNPATGQAPRISFTPPGAEELEQAAKKGGVRGQSPDDGSGRIISRVRPGTQLIDLDVYPPVEPSARLMPVDETGVARPVEPQASPYAPPQAPQQWQRTGAMPPAQALPRATAFETAGELESVAPNVGGGVDSDPGIVNPPLNWAGDLKFRSQAGEPDVVSIRPTATPVQQQPTVRSSNPPQGYPQRQNHRSAYPPESDRPVYPPRKIVRSQSPNPPAGAYQYPQSGMAPPANAYGGQTLGNGPGGVPTASSAPLPPGTVYANPAANPQNGQRTALPSARSPFDPNSPGFQPMPVRAGQPGAEHVAMIPSGADGQLPVQTQPYVTEPYYEPLLPLDIYVDETQTGRFMVGVGVNSDAGVVGSVTIDERNFDWRRVPTSWEDIRNGTAWRGAGQRFRVELLPGSQVQRYMVNFQEPYFLDTPVSLGLSAFFFDRNYLEWDEQRLGGRVSLGYQLTPDLSTTIAYRGENVNIHDPASPTPPDVQDALGDNALHGFKVSVAHDTRDNTFLATEGHFIELSFEQVIGSFDYPRAELDARQYFLLYQRPDGSGRHVMSVSGRLGFSGSQTPVYDHYFAGGFSTLRGFDFRSASPRQLGIIVGGEFMMLGSVEYLFPITANDALRGVVFCDFGTVEQDVEIEDFRVAPGAGLRVTVPALGPAPIALDSAFPVVKAEQDREQVFSFNVGFLR